MSFDIGAFGTPLQETMDKVKILEDNHWLDKQTKKMELILVTLNVNVGLFNQVQLYLFYIECMTKYLTFKLVLLIDYCFSYFNQIRITFTWDLSGFCRMETELQSVPIRNRYTVEPTDLFRLFLELSFLAVTVALVFGEVKQLSKGVFMIMIIYFMISYD
tara:strand:- start:212 stop:691 length:480 start_codon:yes stop_codon:yes gene_type:complete